jgi:thiamine biosynthesis protein ThiI
MPIPLPYNAILCRYDEIATKGRNRGTFEHALVRSLRRQLKSLGPLDVVRERGRIYLVPRGRRTFSPDRCRRAFEAAERVFGLASLSPGFLFPPTLEAVEAVVSETFDKVYEAWERLRPGDSPIRYAMRARRTRSSFPMTSQELEVLFAERLLPVHPRLRIDLRHPELRIEVDIRQRRAFLTYESFPGPRGLPLGTGGHLVTLLDASALAPLACYRMMRRGCTSALLLVTDSDETGMAGGVEGLQRTAVRLRAYQHKGGVYTASLCAARERVLASEYRELAPLLLDRLKVRLAAAVAQLEGGRAVVTGDNLLSPRPGAFAHLQLVDRAVPLPILRPLIAISPCQAAELAGRLGIDLDPQTLPGLGRDAAADRKGMPVTAPETLWEAERELGFDPIPTGALHSTNPA